MPRKKEKDECWSSLDKDSKRTFRRFMSCTDKSVEAMITFAELFVNNPQLAKLRLPTRNGGVNHYPLIAAVLHYGVRDTHPTIAVHLIRKILQQYPEALDQRIPNFYGFDWRPTSGWSALGISCLKQCHPQVIEFLRDEMLERNLTPAEEENVSATEALFAAMIIHDIDTAKSIVRMDPRCVDSTLSITHRQSETSCVWRCPRTVVSSLQQSDLSDKTLELLSENNDGDSLFVEASLGE